MPDAKISALTAGTPASTDILPYTDLGTVVTKKTTVASLAQAGQGSITISESQVTNLVSDLALKEDKANKGIAGGYASLDGSWKIPLAQIPGNVGHVIQDEGVSLTQRNHLNFIGATVTATDNAGNDATDVTINAIGDAPNDGNTYARKNAAWSTIVVSGGVNPVSETPSGTVNGINKTFTLSVPPAWGILFVNGVEQKPTTDYTIAGSTIIFTNAPITGAILWFDGYTNVQVAGWRLAHIYSGSSSIASGISLAVYTGSGGHTLTLPAATVEGAWISVQVAVKNLGSGSLIISKLGGETIDGLNQTITTFPKDSVTFASDGISNWSIT